MTEGRRQKNGTFGWWGLLGGRPQFSAKKVTLFVFASVRCRSLQNVLKHIKTVKFMSSTLSRVVQKQAVKSTFYENTQ